MTNLKEKGKYFNLNDCYMYLDDDVKEAVLQLVKYKKSCFYDIKENYDKYNPDEVNSHYERKRANKQFEIDLEMIREIFGDFEK